MGATATLMISAVAGGATMATILLWLAAMSRCDVWGSAGAFQRRGAGAPQKTTRRCASGRLACTQCAQRSSPRVIDKRLARRAREMLRAATKVGWLQ